MKKFKNWKRKPEDPPEEGGGEDDGDQSNK